MKSDAWLKEWIRDRNEAASSFDVEKFKAFYRKWAEKGVYDRRSLPSNEVLEITMRKMTVNIPELPQEKRDEAEKWLLSRGYDATFR